MKLDIDTLRRAVNQKLVSEQFVGFSEPVDIHPGSHTSHHDHNFHEEEEHTDGGDELEMTKQNLFQLSVYAAKLHDMMQDGEDVEEWVQEKIVEATSKISDVYHYLEYQSYKNSK